MQVKVVVKRLPEVDRFHFVSVSLQAPQARDLRQELRRFKDGIKRRLDKVRI
jgi:hypothetical protein